MVFPGNNQPPATPSPLPAPARSVRPRPSSLILPAGPVLRQLRWKYILIGCLAFILLGGIVTVGSCALLAARADRPFQAHPLHQVRVRQDLTPDHTPEQRAASKRL